MRRKEFSIEEHKEIEEFLGEMSFGYLGTVGEDGCPHLTPLNYVYLEGSIYFHGSHAGAKMREIAEAGKVSFAVAKEFAIIPSYYSDERLACPATAFFKSVHIRGLAEKVDGLEEKAQVLTAFMEKLQPEGGYDPITPLDPEYMKGLKAVAVVRIKPEEITAKFKFGQNMNEEHRGKIMTGLEERSKPEDLETIEMMKKYCPFHKE